MQILSFKGKPHLEVFLPSNKQEVTNAVSLYKIAGKYMYTHIWTL